jgi:hypothetical protein
MEGALISHKDVSLELKKAACALFRGGGKHSEVLSQLGIAPDPENKLIHGWLAELEEQG